MCGGNVDILSRRVVSITFAKRRSDAGGEYDLSLRGTPALRRAVHSLTTAHLARTAGGGRNP